jgi:hypothetical protein
MGSMTDVHIERIAVDKYIVKLVDGFTNDLGEMTQTELFAYLNVRPLLDATPQQVVDTLRVGGKVIVHFQRLL